MNKSKETLLSLKYIDGILKQVFIDENGNKIIRDIEGFTPKVSITSTNIEDRFKDTQTVPNDDLIQKTCPIIRKNMAKELSSALESKDNSLKYIQDHIDRDLKLNGLLVKICGDIETYNDETNDRLKEFLRKNSAFKEVFLELLLIMGDPWKQIYEKLTK